MGAFTATAHGLSTPREEDWRHRALCVHRDPELFFPEGNSGPALRQAARAKAKRASRKRRERVPV